MIINIIFILILIYIFIRTVAYGIYCLKQTGIAGGISVFVLGAFVIITGYMTVFRVQL